MGGLSLIPADDPKQAIRIRRYFLAGGFSLIYLCALVGLYFTGRLPARVLAEAAALVLSLIVAFYAIFRSRLNLRSSDPSLTEWQMMSAVLTMLYVAYRDLSAREIFESFVFIAFMFGMLRLPTRRLGILAGVSLALFGAVLSSDALHDSTREALERDVIQWAILAITLPWCILIGGYIRRLRTELAAADTRIEEIEDRASRDELTGAHNRRMLTAAMKAEKLRCDRSGAVFSLCIIDIDHFKRINDEVGHLAGDEVLRSLAGALKSRQRSTDVFGRYGGDEFVQILTNTSLDGAVIEAERMRHDVAALHLPLDGGRPCTISIGVAQYRSGEAALDTFQRADLALYEAKRGGRNRIAVRRE